jgi:hypothetical protein
MPWNTTYILPLDQLEICESSAMSRRVSRPKWHKVFLGMLPKIVSYARTAFKHRDPEAREDLVQEVVVNACVAFKALWDRGKQALAYATVLANYGIRQVRDHRKVGGKLNIKDVLSPHCQKHKGVVVERLAGSTRKRTLGKRRWSRTPGRPRCPTSWPSGSISPTGSRASAAATGGSPSRWPWATAPATWPSGSR